MRKELKLVRNAQKNKKHFSDMSGIKEKGESLYSSKSEQVTVMAVRQNVLTYILHLFSLRRERKPQLAIIVPLMEGRAAAQDRQGKGKRSLS